MKGNRFSVLRVVVALAFLCPAIAAQQPEKTKSSPSVEVSKPAQSPLEHTSAISQLGWLEGRWRGEWGTRIAEQIWMGPKAGVVTGEFRLVEGEKTLVLELFSIVEKADGIQLYLRHFTPELLPWEKSDATTLKLESIDGARATFVNPTNGEPKRAILIRADADTYTARSEIEPEQGEAQTIEITFHRVRPPAAAPSGGSGERRKKP